MRMKRRTRAFLILACLFLIFVVEFFLDEFYGWLEVAGIALCVAAAVYNFVRLVRSIKAPRVLTGIVGTVGVLVILWYAMLAVDFKRFMDFDVPIFNVPGCRVEQSAPDAYRSEGSFYLFGIEIGWYEFTRVNE